MSQSTITVQSVLNLASAFTELMPLSGVGGYTNEPALSIVQDTMAELLSPPFAWKFNSATSNLLVTQQNRQDFQFAGASAWTVNGGVGIGLAATPAISESGNTVTVNTLDPHNFSVGATVFMLGNTVSAYNSTFTQDGSSSSWSGGWVITAVPSATSFQFTHASSGLGNSGASGITDMGWLENSTMVNMNDQSAVQFVWYLTTVRTLEPWSRVAIPERISVMKDDGAGILTLRVRPLPGPQPFGITLTYQKRPPLAANLNGTWAPFPDEFAFVYRQMFLAHAFRFANSPRSEIEYQKAQLNIGKALTQNDREQSEEFLSPAQGLMSSQTWGGWWF